MKNKYPWRERLRVNLAILGFKVLIYFPMPILRLLSVVIELGMYQASKYNWLPAMRRRYAIALINLQLCFPENTELERRKIWRASFRESVLGYLNYGLLFCASPNKLRQRIKCQGLDEVLKYEHSQAAIILVPHFCAFDIGMNRVSLDVSFCSIYKYVDNYFYECLRLARLRFVKPDDNSVIYSIEDGLIPVVRVLQNKKLPLFYLPDLDYGETNSIYAPFFQQSRATLNTLPRLAKLAKAVVIPSNSFRRGNYYYFEFKKAVDKYPTGNNVDDVETMNSILERVIREHPEHYRWYFPIFNTQPNKPDGYLYEGAEDKIVF